MRNNINVRQSNFELLRIVAMFLVLIVHANFYSNSIPTTSEITSQTLPSLTRFFIQAISIVCVNVFVLISGYWGINTRKKGLCNYLFQCLFFSIGIYWTCVILGVASINLDGILGTIFLTNDLWFVKAYLFLYILAPILNAFITHSSRQQFKNTLIAFFTCEFIWGWIYNATSYINNGYSIVSFIGLYLLARYIRLYSPKWSNLNKNIDLSIYILSSVVLTVLSIITLFIASSFYPAIYIFTNPIVIVSSVYLVLFFSKINIQNNFINNIAKSCFAVYLFHCHYSIFDPIFRDTCQRLYLNYSSITCISIILGYCILIFSIAIIIDKFRLFVWNRLERYIY